MSYDQYSDRPTYSCVFLLDLDKCDLKRKEQSPRFVKVIVKVAPLAYGRMLDEVVRHFPFLSVVLDLCNRK